MITLFLILFVLVFGKLLWLAIRAAWGITKICFTIVFLPIILVVLVASGLVAAAIPILLVVGIIALVAGMAK